MPDLDSMDKNHNDFSERGTSLRTLLTHVATCSTIGKEMQTYHSSDLTQRRRASSPTGCDCTEHCFPPAQELLQHVHTPCTHAYIVQHIGALVHYNGTSPRPYIYYCSLYMLCIFLYQYICIHTCTMFDVSQHRVIFMV